MKNGAFRICLFLKKKKKNLPLKVILKIDINNGYQTTIDAKALEGMRSIHDQI